MTVVAVEMSDDRGRSNLPAIERLLDALDLTSQLHVVTRDNVAGVIPEWSERGPHLDSMPATNRRISEIAAERGARLVLTGNGADELLGTTRYLFGALLRVRDLRGVARYFGDTIAAAPRALPWELLGLTSPALPRRLRTVLFLAIAWPELLDRKAPPVLGASFRGVVSTWTDHFMSRLEEVHMRHPNWATMDAWDSVSPPPELPQPGLVRWASPFREPAFRRAAQRLPLVQRYDARAGHPYWRAKAQVLQLLPAEPALHLPVIKDSFASELEAHHRALSRDAPTCASLGLVDAGALRACDDPSVIARVAALETWVAGALARGVGIER